MGYIVSPFKLKIIKLTIISIMQLKFNRRKNILYVMTQITYQLYRYNACTHIFIGFCKF